MVLPIIYIGGNEMNKLKTPALSVIGESKANDVLEEGLKTLTENWRNSEPDREDPNCILHYGVDKGEVFGYCEQTDIADYLEYAQYLRDNEIKIGSKDLPFGKIKWVMPRIIKLEMMSRGYPVDEIVSSGDLYEIDVFIEKNFPSLKTTNLILAKQKVPVIA